MSRQSDSNRRPADYKSAALNQLSYAGAAPYESRFQRVHQELSVIECFTRQSRGAPQDGLLQARMLPDSSRSMDQQLRKFVR
jgi:hypothetical protein